MTVSVCEFRKSLAEDYNSEETTAERYIMVEKTMGDENVTEEAMVEEAVVGETMTVCVETTVGSLGPAPDLGLGRLGSCPWASIKAQFFF